MPAKPAKSDNDLMNALQGGDASALEELLRRHGQYVANIAYRYLQDRDEAQDMVQEVFTRVYLNRHGYKPTAKFTTWLYTIVSHASLNYIRDVKKRQPKSLDAMGTTTAIFEVADTTSLMPTRRLSGQELKDVVSDAVQNLPPQQRMAILLYRFQEMEYPEIAKAMNVSIPALKSLIFRARATLAETLEQYIRKQ